MKPIVLAFTSAALITAGCGGRNPGSPSAVMPVSGADGSSSSSSSTSVIGTATWSCLTASRAGLLASAISDGTCPVHVSPLTVGSSALAAPGAPQNLMFSVNNSVVSLHWNGSPPGTFAATSFVIEAGSAPGTSDIVLFDTGTSGLGYQATSVPIGTYYVRVRARNSAGTSDPSNEVIITVGGGTGPTPCATAPAAPTGLSGRVAGTSVTFSWTAPTGGCAASSYVLQAGSATGASNLANFNTGSAATSYTATSVPTGTYYVRVLGASSTGTGAASNEVIVTVGSATVSLTGSWAGTFIATGEGSEPITLTLTQTGSAVTGTALKVDPCNCEFPRALTGQTSGSVFTFAWDDTNAGSRCTRSLTGTAQVTDNSMMATWSQTLSGSCSGPASSGTFTVTRR